MAISGALLKPSGKRGAVKRKSVVAKTSRYEVLKDKIRTWWNDRISVGEALREIQTEKLYKAEYSSFEDFCEHEYGIKHSQAYRLIEAAGVRDSVKVSPIGDKLKTESQARALAPVPEEKRAEVLEETAKTGPVTAKRITETAAKVVTPKDPPPTEESEKHYDKTGYLIPDSLVADWLQADTYRSTLNQLQAIKLQVEKAVEKDELIFREIGQDTVADLKNAWATLKQVLPYAVCPTCQGRTRSKCTACKRRGFVSEFGYKHWFAKEVIELRERAIKK